MSRFLLVALALTAALAGCGWGVGSPAAHAAAKPATGPVEAGTIHGWTGGDATLYATVGFFSPNPEIVAVGAVLPDGSFSVASDHKLRVASKEDMTLHSDGQLTIEVQSDASAKSQAGSTMFSSCFPNPWCSKSVL